MQQGTTDVTASPTERIIFLPPHRLGDCLFWTPAPRYLRQHRPGIEIDVLAISPGPSPGQCNQVVLEPSEGGEITAEQVIEALSSWLG